MQLIINEFENSSKFFENTELKDKVYRIQIDDMKM
jgi:hypothetical protein